MSKPVVRFAPSPTGPLHMGGVRTALYNYLFAKREGGTCILRIEDTDQERFVPGAEEYIIDALQWCGIEFDEGPHVGGERGPYRQSDRSDLYKGYIEQLVKDGHAYLAFDTPEEIDAMRESLRAEGQVAPTYGWATRSRMKNSISLAEDEVQALLDADTPHVVRMKIPKKGEVRFFDEVRDYVKFHASQLDDKVLMKSDGLPTYHLANVVDDHLMGITHVIRGEEWLSSTPLHVLLYRALGWEDSMPKFVHLPLILKPDPAEFLASKGFRNSLAEAMGQEFLTKFPEHKEKMGNKATDFTRQIFGNWNNIGAVLKENEKDSKAQAALRAYLKNSLFGKLSKRDGDRLGFPVFPTTWTDPKSGDVSKGYREEGYLPQAFMNGLALMGWNPGDDEELMNMDRLIERYSLDRISKSGARFNASKMRWFNQTYLRSMEPAALRDLVTADLNAHNLPVHDDAYLDRAIAMMQERITFPQEIVASAPFLFEAPVSFNEKMASKKWNADAESYVMALAERWNALDAWNSEKLHASFEAYLEEKELGVGAVMSPLRFVLTAAGAGPGVFDIAELIGKDETMRRIEYARNEMPTG
ncbi:MAG: glutamate--tRNA ligase [Bacteroidia bacterium]